MKNDMRLYIDRIDGQYCKRISEGLSHIELGSRLKRGDTVVIKPNLTFPEYKAGVMTNPDCIEKLILALKDYTDNIIIGEGDAGGYNRFSMDDVFEKVGIITMAKRHGVKVVNFSKLSSKDIHVNFKRKDLAVPIPKMLLEQTDLFISVPLPKVHILTKVSISIKNQWGCIADPPTRLRLHPYFEKVIWEINKVLNPISVVDGRFGLNRSGPLRGDVVELNWIIVSNNTIVADTVCCNIMGIDPLTVNPLGFINQNVPLPDLASVKFNKDYLEFVGQKFYLRRELCDYPSCGAFRSPMLAYLAYFSPLAKFGHKILYLFREPFYDYDRERCKLPSEDE